MTARSIDSCCCGFGSRIEAQALNAEVYELEERISENAYRSLEEASV